MLLDRHERRCCDEPVPAVGGLPPRQAAADPTRRDEVLRLTGSFRDIEPASGASASPHPTAHQPR
jgi:hypothetical protein